ncbi:MAG: methyltransferase domain-containing protein [Xenococcus sp. (in: cyanobacteria)]
MDKNSLCLHIGCGLIIGNSWKNIDFSPSLKISKIPLIGQSLVSLIGGPNWSCNVECQDIVKGLPIKANSCDLIYASHVLEHLSLYDFHKAMENIATYLKPGGIFRTIVPDLEQYINAYIQKQKDSQLVSQAAPNFIKAIGMGEQQHRNSITQRLKTAFANNRHQWMWDEVSLAEAFQEHGFKSIRRCHYGDFSDSRFAEIEQTKSFVNAVGIEGIA